MAKFFDDRTTKKPNSTVEFKDSREAEKALIELLKCEEDPLYFMENFMLVQHSIRGQIKFDPYPYQKNVIKSFHKHRNVIFMSGRQQGKCSTFDTIISINGKPSKIGDLMEFTLREKIVNFLEKLLIKLSI